MSTDRIFALAEQRVFQPRSQFAQLVHDHVAFDDLASRPAFESVAARALVQQRTSVAVRGPVGAGKSSLIAAVCAALPDTHIALRVPIVGADDPTSVSVLAALTLSGALAALELERGQREALERARADHVSRDLTPARFGGKLGGGPVPVEVHGELETLSEHLQRNRLAGERLAGLDRLVSILVARGLEPTFVLEDTEAAVGGRDEQDQIEAFFAGPVSAFVQEVDAACLIAVQDPLAAAPAFRRLAPSLELIDLPAFPDAHAALTAIAAHRLTVHELDFGVADVIGADAIDALVAFYDEANRSLRLTLAALQSAADHAADLSADLLRAAHVRVGTQEWRSHVAES
ncbi:MAG: hypothetical protein M3401_05925 [Actinomycetota bacterium]|nr:hypothetical protein [Actinomycetota bacterium]